MQVLPTGRCLDRKQSDRLSDLEREDFPLARPERSSEGPLSVVFLGLACPIFGDSTLSERPCRLVESFFVEKQDSGRHDTVGMARGAWRQVCGFEKFASTNVATSIAACDWI